MIQMHWLLSLYTTICQPFIFCAKMCKRYEKQFLLFLSGKKINGENKFNENDKKKKKIQSHLIRELSSSLERNIKKAKYISKEFEAQERVAR